MSTQARTPLTLIGPRWLYRVAHFGIRYLGFALFPASIVIAIAFVQSAFNTVGMVGGLVLSLGVVFLGSFGLVLFRVVLQQIDSISPRYRSKGYINLDGSRGNVIVTSALDLKLGERVMMSCKDRAITIHSSHGDYDEIPLDSIESVEFEPGDLSGVVVDTNYSVMRLVLRSGVVLDFALSLEATTVWREALIRAVNYGSGTAG